MEREEYNRTWERAAAYRRALLLFLTCATTATATGYMAFVLLHRGGTIIEAAIIVLFACLFAWISLGFWTSFFGFMVLLLKKDRWNPSRFLAHRGNTHGPPQTALLMPIYNEDVERVFQGISVIYRSLRRTGQEKYFDFFILSDTQDPDLWVQEEIAWQETRRSLKASSSIFYRHRIANTKRKSGNIADFCRRWGGNYRYFIVLDADSIMSGETIVNMVRIMEADTSIGILQTIPVPVGGQTLLARAQQFAGQMYNHMFAAGLHFWQLGDAQYWGHNAIIRIEPFMKHCALPKLSGSPPLGGDILSHDFVEAAFMRRAGWGVWLAYDMEGSYEELPPTLLDELGRDRRWCQGNLQHLRLLFTKGLLPVHRFLFFNGAMSYLSSPVWLIFLGLNTVEAIVLGILERYYFPWLGILPSAESLWDLEVLRFLLIATMLLLFLPKLFALFVNLVARRRSSSFGDPIRLVSSLVAEALTSALLAPLRMLAHSRFVLATLLLGGRIEWTPPPRDTRGISWREGLLFGSAGSILALPWASLLFFSNPVFFWWLVPILFPLFMGAPISVLFSKWSVGRDLRRLGLFLTPSESQPAAELRDLAAQRAGLHRAHPPEWDGSGGFVAAVVMSTVNDLHRKIQCSEPGAADPLTEGVNLLIEKALKEGPNSLSVPEKMQLLANVSSMQQLHERVRELPDGERTSGWGPWGDTPPPLPIGR